MNYTFMCVCVRSKISSQSDNGNNYLKNNNHYSDIIFGSQYINYY